MADPRIRVTTDVFMRVAMGAIGALMTFAVNFLGHIASDIADLKTTVAVIANTTEAQGRDIEKLKTAVFSDKP